ncbi:MAG: LacI family DNA-binding transcriptional regulator [Treponema sp.]|nr:LacI family DNA-binding transcriptional regulator [Treponema sp.]
MVTIYDIAKRTGYSAPTVSKALNGTGTLNGVTRQTIIRIAEEMGYKPNISARTLSTKKSNLIGVIYDDTGMNRGFAHPLFSVVLNRFREQIEFAGYDLVFLSRHFKMSYYAHSQYRSVDGVIIINPATGDKSEFDEFIQSDMPRVSTNSLFDGICTVISDNEKGGYVAAEELIKKGHRKIAFISAPRNGISSAPIERWKGFKKALDDYKIPFDDELFVESRLWDKKGAYEAFESLYKRRKDFTAVFCVTDLLAFGVYEYAEKNGLRIPDDISVIGFDDDAADALMSPHLTTFRQDALRIADIASEMMLNQIAGLPVPEIVRCEAEFIERKSVKSLL